MNRLYLIGGFLGAGKTTFLWEAARRFTDRGEQVGLITNDQASALVDTAFLKKSNGEVSEVSGSCFCCNYPGFSQAIEGMESAGMTVVLAEPVGSCTDLSATIMQPLKADESGARTVMPLTVMADPDRLSDLLEGGCAGLHESAAYIVRKQLEESDIILISKADLLDEKKISDLISRTEKAYPGRPVIAVSAKTGDGMELWMDIIGREKKVGARIVPVDYDIYAEGEAVLGWLNATMQLQGEGVDWTKLTEALTAELSRVIDSRGLSVGHVKLMTETESGYVLTNLTGDRRTKQVRGDAGTGNKATLTINARVETDPDSLKELVGQCVEKICSSEVSCEVTESACLSPGRPNPTYRYDQVV